MARSRLNDFIDFVLDAMLAAVERTFLLVEFCHKDPKSTVEEIAKGFPDWGGYKRGPDQKREWVAKMLRSMSAVGVPLPEVIAVAVGEDIGDRYEFDEIAYARGWNMRLAWNDFKEAQEIDYHYRCIEESDPDEEPGVATETVDYGLITMAEVVLGAGRLPDPETLFDLHRIGEDLGPELTSLMEQMHTVKPADGYKPIAWHNVFWNIPSEYEALPITLETRDPLCDADQKLADHIAENYRDIAKPNRLNVFRRRDALYKACKKKVLERLRAWVNKTASGSHM